MTTANTKSTAKRTSRASALLRALAVAVSLAVASNAECGQPVENAGPYYSFWSPTERDIGYLFAGTADRVSDAGAAPHTVLTVGAQINVHNRAGVDQIAFGIATEAWAEPGSRSMLTGLEATTINREPDNPYRKISLWSTFKNRSDGDYYTVPADPMNVNSQALRIESQIGTGFERGIVFAPISLHESRRMPRAAAIDLSEIPDERIGEIDLVRVRSDVALRYDPATRSLYLYRDGDAPHARTPTG